MPAISIEHTAYPYFKKLTSARMLHVFFILTAEEVTWARERTSSPSALFALVPALKCHQKMAWSPSVDEIPEIVVDHMRSCLELDEGTVPYHGAARSSSKHRRLARKRLGVNTTRNWPAALPRRRSAWRRGPRTTCRIWSTPPWSGL